jgi:hypothetical protein
MHGFFFYINVDTCELGFHPLSCHTVFYGGDGGSRRYGPTILFFGTLQSVSVVGWGGGFVPMVMVMERGDGTGAWSFSNMSVLQWILLHCTVCYFGESDS